MKTQQRRWLRPLGVAPLGASEQQLVLWYQQMSRITDHTRNMLYLTTQLKTITRAPCQGRREGAEAQQGGHNCNVSHAGMTFLEEANPVAAIAVFG